MRNPEKLLVLAFLAGLGAAAACNIARPVVVKPSVEDCQRALVQIDVDQQAVIAAVVSMELEDLAPGGAHRHIPEWWEQKLSQLRGVAHIASSVGRK